jgi:hypothetical protein
LRSAASVEGERALLGLREALRRSPSERDDEPDDDDDRDGELLGLGLGLGLGLRLRPRGEGGPGRPPQGGCGDFVSRRRRGEDIAELA